MSGEVHSCPLCKRPLPEGEVASGVVHEVTSKSLDDSVKLNAFLNFCQRHPHAARLLKNGTLPDTGFFFLDTPSECCLFLRDFLFLDCADALLVELQARPRVDSVWLNCPGGSHYDARRIADVLKEKRVPKCVIHGCCMSAAILISCACESVLIDSQASMAVHPVSSAVMGTSKRMREAALEMDLASEATIEAIVAKTKKSESEVRSWFSHDKTTFFSAAQAIELGLADGFFETPAFEVPA
jgi:ATP-dependent protease ClpP protease subunit